MFPAMEQMLQDMLMKLLPEKVRALLSNPQFYEFIQTKANEEYTYLHTQLGLLDEINERLKRLENDNGSGEQRPTLRAISGGGSDC